MNELTSTPQLRRLAAPTTSTAATAEDRRRPTDPPRRAPIGRDTAMPRLVVHFDGRVTDPTRAPWHRRGVLRRWWARRSSAR